MEHTFTLTITGTENAEWQGHIQKENDPPADFQSLLELIKIIKHDLEEEA